MLKKKIKRFNRRFKKYGHCIDGDWYNLVQDAFQDIHSTFIDSAIEFNCMLDAKVKEENTFYPLLNHKPKHNLVLTKDGWFSGTHKCIDVIKVDSAIYILENYKTYTIDEFIENHMQKIDKFMIYTVDDVY